MKSNRFWIEIVVLGIVIACASALLIASLGAAAAAVAGHPETGQAAQSSALPSPSDSPSIPSSPDLSPAPRLRTYEGMVTDSRCGAKHSARLGETAEVCIRECVRGGASFALVDGDRTYMLDGDLMLLKKVAGQRVRVAGAIQGKTITVTSVAAVS